MVEHQLVKFDATSSSSSKRHREKTALERRKSYNAQSSKKEPPNYKPYTGKAMPMYEIAPSNLCSYVHTNFYGFEFIAYTNIGTELIVVVVCLVYIQLQT